VALPIETRAYGPLAVPKSPPVRAQTRPLPEGDGEAVQRAAQAFVQTLPGDVRERQAQINRDAPKKNGFTDAQRTEEERTSSAAVEGEGFRPASASEAQENAFSSSTGFARFTPVANLVQAQLLQQESEAESQAAPSNAIYEASHKAYLSAGAQPGGRSEALKAALLREEQANRTFVIPPVQTSVNFVA